MNILQGCTDSAIDREVEPVVVDFQMIRLDQEIFKDERLEIKHERLRESFPNFYSMYFRDILQLGPLDDSFSEGASDFGPAPVAGFDPSISASF